MIRKLIIPYGQEKSKGGNYGFLRIPKEGSMADSFACKLTEVVIDYGK